MDLKKFYEDIGGSYAEIKARFGDDSLIERFVKMFPGDENFLLLKKHIEEQNWKEAFLSVHTLKGVSANLSLKKLYSAASALTEDIREGTPSANTQDDYEKVVAEYDAVIKALGSDA